MADAPIIETVKLSKAYPGVEALKGLDLHVQRGSICGFLGRNGAGKSTTLKILLGMTRPSGGEARVLGLDASDRVASVSIRQRVGFVSEGKELYDYMTVAEMIRFTASFYPRWNHDAQQQYVRRFGLPLESRVKTLSMGTRTRLALLLALCRRAELLVLDEPTSGLDPAMQEETLQALVTHAATEGATIFFSSHQIAEIEQIADHVVIIDRGRTVVHGALDDLRECYRRIQLVFADDAPEVAFHAPGVQNVRRKGRVLACLASLGSQDLLDEARALNPVSVEVSPVSLKEIFLESVRED